MGSQQAISLVGSRPPDLKRLPVLLHRAREAFSVRFRDVFQQHDLTDQQWRILLLIRSDPSSDISDLVRRSFLLGPSLTRILRSLVERGLITRRPDPLDARRAFHELTPEGATMIEAVAPDFDPVYDDLGAKLDPEHLARLTMELEALLRALNPRALD